MRILFAYMILSQCLVAPVWALVRSGSQLAERPLDSNTPIRILLAKASRSAQFEAANGMYVRTGNQAEWVLYGRKLEIQVDALSRILINGRTTSTRTLYIAPPKPANPVISLNGVRHSGSFQVFTEADGLSIVHTTHMEEYLPGILMGEMNPHWPLEALKAQAVAARTYALYMVRNPRHLLYDVEATTRDQVFRGSDNFPKSVLEAVKSTAGEFLSIGSSPIKAYFHSRCGGVTDIASSVWFDLRPRARDSEVLCPYCNQKRFQWESVLPVKSFLKLVQLPDVTVEKLQITPKRKSPGGRITLLEIATPFEKKQVSADAFRNLLGYSRIKSALFQWKIENGEITFTGQGNGHGVGMCQWGAKAMAETGKKYQQILRYFYPASELQVPSRGLEVRKTVLAKKS